MKKGDVDDDKKSSNKRMTEREGGREGGRVEVHPTRRAAHWRPPRSRIAPVYIMGLRVRVRPSVRVPSVAREVGTRGKSFGGENK